MDGWKKWHDSKYGPLQMNPQLRSKFVEVAKEFVKTNNFDGMELNLDVSL